VKGFDQNNNRGSMTLYNCTAYRNGINYQVSSRIRSTSVLTVKNSVALGNYGSLASFAIQATNSWMPPFVVTNDDFTGIDTTGVRGPRHADGSLPDVPFMHLAAGSDLLDAGTYVGLPYNGGAPDLGCFETGPMLQATVQTSPAGLSFSVDGSTYGSAQTFSWTGGSSHTISTPGLQDGTTGTRYQWIDWSDGGGITHVVTPANDMTFTADFAAQHALTLVPEVGGAVTATPAQQWYNEGDTVQINAIPDTGFQFTSWSGAGSGSYSGPSNPVTIIMNSPVHDTAGFALVYYTITASAGPNGSISPSGSSLVEYGGNKTFTMNPDSTFSLDSLLVDGVLVLSSLSYEFTGVTQDHSIRASFNMSPVVKDISVSDGWNMVSVPVTVTDRRTTALFPTAVNYAYRFDSTAGYVRSDTLNYGIGYWLRFSGPQSVAIHGLSRNVDTITVHQSWNLIGSISNPVPVSTIQEIPAGIITSPIYAYDGSHFTEADTLSPGRAYWVKAGQDGICVLRRP
jgi:hypothetical protein